MITQYTWPTPNGHKVSILIAELGLENEVVAVDINKGDQFDPGFLKLSPNNRIPAIVDHDPADGGAPVAVFETGAIMIYLAEKEGRFLPDPNDIRARKSVMEWLMSRIKRLIVSMSCKVGCVTLYRNVSHPVSQIMKRSAGKVSQAR